MLNQLNGVSVKAIIIELTDGTMIYKEAPQMGLTVEAIVNSPPPKIEAAVVEPVVEPEPESVVEPPKKKRGGGRRKKAAAEQPVEKPVEKPKPSEQMGKPQDERLKVCIPLVECKGVALYEKKGGGHFMVAIYKSGVHRNGTPWYKLLFVSKDEEWAYSTLKDGFYGSPAKMSAIEWF